MKLLSFVFNHTHVDYKSGIFIFDFNLTNLLITITSLSLLQEHCNGISQEGEINHQGVWYVRAGAFLPVQRRGVVRNKHRRLYFNYANLYLHRYIFDDFAQYYWQEVSLLYTVSKSPIKPSILCNYTLENFLVCCWPGESWYELWRKILWCKNGV